MNRIHSAVLALTLLVPTFASGQHSLFPYKSDWNGKPESVRAQGLAIADDPLGPFETCPTNPVLNSGHETGLFHFRGGIAALVIRHGNEQNMIQFAPDGVNFKIASIVSLMPIAPGPYVPDAFTDIKTVEELPGN